MANSTFAAVGERRENQKRKRDDQNVREGRDVTEKGQEKTKIKNPKIKNAGRDVITDNLEGGIIRKNSGNQKQGRDVEAFYKL